MSDQYDNSDVHLELTAEITCAYVANNSVPAGELAKLIGDIHQSITTLAAGEVEPAVLTPAVSIKKSVQHDHIVCLEDGKKFMSLKRHLSTYHGMTPDEYRSKWGLPLDYPMTARAYSEKRSSLAKAMGLGRKPAVQAESMEAPIKHSRKRKAA